MKSIILKLFIILAGVAVLFSSGCKKNEKSPTNLQSQVMTPQNAKILRQIENFKMDMKSNLKTDRELSIDSTIWYIEAALNESYARPDTTKELLLVDSTHINISLNKNNTVLLSSISSTYSNLVTALTNHYDSIVGQKSLVLAHISLLSIQSNRITVTLTDYIASKPINPAPYDWRFGMTDYWYWGEYRGKCGSYSGYAGQDASTQLTTYANGALRQSAGTFFTTVTSTPQILPPDVPTSGNPYGYDNFLLFMYSGDNECLCPGAMNYYLDNLSTIASLHKPAYLSVSLYYCHWTITVGSPEDQLHFAIISYGYPCYTQLPASTL